VVEIQGTTIRLRSPKLDDVEALAAARDADPTYMGPRGDEAREYLRTQVEQRPTLERDGFLGLVVERDGRLVGDIQARAPLHAAPPGVCEIGILLFADVRGHGIGREAVGLFTDYLLGAGLARVQATTAAGNAAMRRVLDQVGYRFEGVLRDYGPTAGGGREDYAMYSCTLRDRSGR